MKIKTPIVHLQDGGNVQGTGMVFGHTYSPLMNPTSSEGAPRERQSSRKQNDSEKGIFDNSILKDLVGKGITSDVEVAIQGIMQLQQNYESMSDTDKSSTEGMQILNRMALQASQVNRLLRNAAVFKDQQSKAVANEALQEFAVTSQGLVVQNSQNGKIYQISPEQYLKESAETRNQFKLLTNAELINQREYNVQLQNDVVSFQQLNQSTGFVDIKKQIQQLIQNVTSSSGSETRDAYTDGTGKLSEQLTRMQNLSTTPIDNIIQTVKEESNSSSLKRTLDAIWVSLGDNAKNYLKQRAMMYTENPQELESVAKSIIIEIISPKESVKTESDIRVDLGSSKAAAAEKAKIAANKEEWGYYEGLQNDVATDVEQLAISPYGGTHAIYVPGRIYGPLRSKSGELYNNISIGRISELNSVQQTQASFGGEKTVSADAQRGIVYDGSPVYRMTMPARIDPETRVQTPDFALLDGYEKQQREIKAEMNRGKTLSVSEKMNIYKKYGVNQLNANGDPANVYDFYQTQVYVQESIYDDLDKQTKALLTEVDTPGAQNVMDMALASTAEARKANKKSDLWSSGDNVYKGTIYYPVRYDAAVVRARFEDGSKQTTGNYLDKSFKHQALSGTSNQALLRNYNMSMLDSTLEQ